MTVTQTAHNESGNDIDARFETAAEWTADDIDSEDIAWMMDIKAIPEDAHPRHVVALLNLLPFRPPAPVANNPALKEALMHYRSRRAEGASALEAAAFATKMISD